ncbi:hypothetical protein E5D57_009349 [Metarhizium anisopliae]|nr:hypothetical protein E5D57_009349 [Metarhizium anisopliae]
MERLAKSRANNRREDTRPVDPASSYQCPFCSDQVPPNLEDLKQHFKLNHPDDAEDRYIEEAFEHFARHYNDDTEYQ